MMQYKPVDFGAAVPGGWLKELMSMDLENGFIGHLDELLPKFFLEDQLFGRDRRTGKPKDMDLGLVEFQQDVAAEYQWWDAEYQSNWLDGFVRTALLVGSPEMREKMESWVRGRLATQDEDGYLGIYAPDLRYREGVESGELWAQSMLFRALIAYYEATGDETVYESIVRAMRLTMKSYPIHNSKPFSTDKQEGNITCGGLAHGLTITDALFWLYKKTGDREYLDYALWLYDNCSEEPIFQSDIRIPELIDPNIPFKSHGVQTYEHLRILALAKFCGNKPIYEQAYNGYMEKLKKYICPSGGPAGDEWIRPEGADATLTGYEYCSIHELLHSYAVLFELSGDFQWMDRLEGLFLNAALGSHLNEKSSITYLNTDNSYELKSAFKFVKERGLGGIQTRYKYSPTHQDCAVCCVPNAGRILPYYAQSAWFHTEGGFLKTLYGAGILKTDWNGTAVTITESSDFPANGRIKLTVEVAAPVQFVLSLRIPGWCKSWKISAEHTVCGRTILLDRIWNGTTEIELEFEYEIAEHIDTVGDTYYTSGPLVLALPIVSNETIIKTHPLPDYFDTEYEPANGEHYAYSALPGELPKPAGANICKCYWPGQTYICRLLNESNGAVEEKHLVPMADTILRRVTFPKTK